ncbi:MAG: oligosaccharide flippase family protein, partial [Acidobacteriota bacterium]|nr:oligosaccharide flippase family protein [Acidobacteriota bacterium]
GLQRMEFNNAIDVITTILQQFGTIVILARGGGLFQVVEWFAICFAASVVAYFIISSRFLAWRSLVPGYSSEAVGRNIRFGRQMMAISVLGMIQTQSDKMIVSKLLPIGVSGYYGFASGMVSKAMLLTGAIAQAAFPFFSASDSSRREPMLRQYHKLQDLICVGTVPLFAFLTFAARPLFSYTFSPAVAQTLVVPVTWLCLGYYLNGVLNIPFVVSVARGYPQIWARCNFLALFTVLPVAAALVSFFGLSGAGFSWVFYHIFAFGYAVPRVCSECLGISVWKWYAHIGRILALAAATYGLSWTAIEIAGNHSIATLVAGYLGATAIYLVLGYAIGGPEIKETLSQTLGRLGAKNLGSMGTHAAAPSS